MNEIYAIISGESSDWNIEGYVDSEDSAMQICAAHNKESECDDWYFVKAEKMESPTGIIELKYVHQVLFDENMGKWEMRQEPDRYKYFENRDKKIPEHSKIDYWPHNSKVIIATIPMEENNRKKAEEIAQDMLCKFLAAK